MRTRLRILVPLAAFALVVAACGDDSGGDVRSEGGCPSGSGSASGAGSASGGSGSAAGSGSGACPSGSSSGSGSGISQSEIAGSTDNEAVNAAVEEYRAYVIEQVDDTVTKTKVFTDAVRAGDLEAAKAAYAPSRVGWERIEPIAGLVEDIDTAVDARVDDFEGVDDPTWTGWHKLEYLVFDQGTTEGASELADQLDADLATLQEQIPDLDLPPATLPVGASELIEEVSGGKITGEEDRYSHTDLWDFDANVDGSEALIQFLTPALEEANPELLADINAGFEEIHEQLAPYEDGQGGFKPYGELTEADKTAMQATLAGLSENLALVAGELGLE